MEVGKVIKEPNPFCSHCRRPLVDIVDRWLCTFCGAQYEKVRK